MKRRILAIDYGDKRIGLAVSDPLRITAQGLKTIVVASQKEALSRIRRLISAYEVSEIVLGFPKKMDGTEGEKASQVSRFADRLRKETGLFVTCCDERLTSVAARRTLQEMGIKIKGKKEDVDRIAATIILQEYLDSGQPINRINPMSPR